MRQIQQMAQTLLRIAGLKQAGQLLEALSEVDQAIHTLLGPAGDTLTLLDPSSAAHIMGDPDRVLAWATLLSEQAAVLHLQDQAELAGNARRRATALAQEAIRMGVSDRRGAEALIDALQQSG